LPVSQAGELGEIAEETESQAESTADVTSKVGKPE